MSWRRRRQWATFFDFWLRVRSDEQRTSDGERKKGNAGTRRRDEERKRSDAEDYRRSGYGERRVSDSWRSWRECSSGKRATGKRRAAGATGGERLY